MGNRRIGRQRLWAVEKAGKQVDLEAGAGIRDAIVSASQHRQGQELITEIAIDLGVLGKDILGGGAAGAPFGLEHGAGHITQLTEAKYGIITEIRMIMLEVPTSAGVAVVDVDLHFAETGGIQGTALSATPGASTEVLADFTAVGEDTSKEYDDYSTLGQDATAKYLYLVNGNGTGNASEDIQTGGKFLIYIHGFEVPADI